MEFMNTWIFLELFLHMLCEEVLASGIFMVFDHLLIVVLFLIQSKSHFTGQNYIEHWGMKAKLVWEHITKDTVFPLIHQHKKMNTRCKLADNFRNAYEIKRIVCDFVRKDRIIMYWIVRHTLVGRKDNRLIKTPHAIS